ncbi:hypothetical protein GCM10010406_26960 [Streptomyces thermolineatus]|uniref:DUF8175 domain-containing protein n=1 Tax=Streptomyces thermolineatus TaxID=44033 RepID=A0ABN3LV04_9ACTN
MGKRQLGDQTMAPQMTADIKAMAWSAIGVAAAAVGLAGYAILGGDDEPTGTGQGYWSSVTGASPTPSASAAPSASGYAPPEEWTEPERWAVLPRGARIDSNGNTVGFPHTTEGAVAMLATANNTEVKPGWSMVDERLSIYDSYMVSEDKSPENAEKIERDAVRVDREIRREMGLPKKGDLPPGAYLRNHVLGFQVVEESPDEVSIWLLSRATEKAGAIEREKGSYTRALLAVRWDAGDWKLSGAAIRRAMTEVRGKARPEIVAPGDAAFNEAGWTAIREAS